MKNRFAGCRGMLAALLVLCLPGCGKNNQGEQPAVPELPETLKISAVLPEDYPETVPSYSVEWNNLDPEIATEAVMQNPVPEPAQYAEGPAYLYEENGTIKEFLLVYTGAVQGGMSYGFLPPSIDVEFSHRIERDLRKLHPCEFSSNLYEQRFGSQRMESLPEGESLDFLSYEQAKAGLEEMMKACGFPEVQLYFSQTQTVEVLNHNREIYNSSREAYLENLIPGSETAKRLSQVEPYEEIGPEMEHYWFVYRQVQDGIPFANVMWSRETTGNGSRYGTIEAKIGREGLVEFSAIDLFKVGEAVGENTIVSPQEAIDCYVKEYSQALHFETTEITDIQLNFVVIETAEGFVARPAWILSLETETMGVKSVDEKEALPHTKYEFLAVAADSCVILERGSDSR